MFKPKDKDKKKNKGGVSNEQVKSNKSNDPSNSLPRASKMQRKPSMENLLDIQEEVKILRDLIEEEESLKVEDYFAALTNKSQVVQRLKVTAKRQGEKTRCENVLRDINSCIRLIEEKESRPRESLLDLEAVESNSFISQDISRFLNEKKDEVSRRFETLAQIEHEVDVLDREIRRAVNENDLKIFTVLETKIKILYGDLEEIPVEEKQKEIGKKLIKFNKKLQTVRKQLSSHEVKKSFDENEVKRTQSQNAAIILMNIEHDLSDLEVQALTYPGIKGEKSYIELCSEIREKFVMLDNLFFVNEEMNKRLGNARNSTKKLLHELSKKADDNKTAAFNELRTIENLQREVEINRDNKAALAILINDAKNCRDSFEFSKTKKKELLAELDKLLGEKINTNTEKNQSEELSKLVRELKAFEGVWNKIELNLKSNLNVNQNLNPNVNLNLAQILTRIRDSIDQILFQISDSNPGTSTSSNVSLVLQEIISQINSGDLSLNEVSVLKTRLNSIDTFDDISATNLKIEALEMLEDACPDKNLIHFKNVLGKLRKNIDSFNGTYKSILYNKYEEDLSIVLEELDIFECADKKNLKLKFDLYQEGCKLMNALRGRSLRDEKIKNEAGLRRIVEESSESGGSQTGGSQSGGSHTGGSPEDVNLRVVSPRDGRPSELSVIGRDQARSGQTGGSPTSRSSMVGSPTAGRPTSTQDVLIDGHLNRNTSSQRSLNEDTSSKVITTKVYLSQLSFNKNDPERHSPEGNLTKNILSKNISNENILTHDLASGHLTSSHLTSGHLTSGHLTKGDLSKDLSIKDLSNNDLSIKDHSIKGHSIKGHSIKGHSIKDLSIEDHSIKVLSIKDHSIKDLSTETNLTEASLMDGDLTGAAGATSIEGSLSKVSLSESFGASNDLKENEALTHGVSSKSNLLPETNLMPETKTPFQRMIEVHQKLLGINEKIKNDEVFDAFTELSKIRNELLLIPDESGEIKENKVVYLNYAADLATFYESKINWLNNGGKIANKTEVDKIPRKEKINKINLINDVNVSSTSELQFNPEVRRIQETLL